VPEEGAVPHLELSLTEPATSRSRPSARTSLGRWAKAVADATEPSLIINADAVVVALSPACHEMLGLQEPAIGQRLLDVLRLLDFSAAGIALDEGEVSKIPPLLALASGRLARGLLRVECRDGACTLDAIATPLLDGTRPTGSLTFFSSV
jgi:PAS domain-containing protein